MLPLLPQSVLLCFCCARLAIVLPLDPVEAVLAFFAPLAAKRSSKSNALALGLFAVFVAAIVGIEDEDALGFIALKLELCKPIAGRPDAVLPVLVYVGPAGIL